MKKCLVFGTNTELLGVHSEMIGENAFIVRTRRTQNYEKLLVDITEIAPKQFMVPATHRTQARQAARHFNAVSMEFSEILNGLYGERKISSADGSQSPLYIKRSCYVFDAVS